jgi:hypothetical protein
MYCVLTIPNISSEGFYTHEDSPMDSKVSQHICPKGYWCSDGVRRPCDEGYFGDSLGMKDSHCSGSCSAGYYCLAGSPSPHQYPCGNSTVYCPIGSKLPRPVEKGFYSASVIDSIIDLFDGPNINATRHMQGRTLVHSIIFSKVQKAHYSSASSSL